MSLVRHEIEHREMDFLASVTHDLKSPLAAILSTIEMVLQDIKADTYSKKSLIEVLSIAEVAGNDMLELVQNMLTTARIQAGKEIIVPSLLSSTELILRARNLEKTFSSEARCKKVNFSVAVGNLPNYVYWDIQKIRYFAVNNLISNALKFLRSGGTVKVVLDSDQNNNVLISVMDDGPGIPQAERDKVFGKFVQATNSPRDIHGSGFGLYNAHQIVAMHHGRIEILDGLNDKGVTFRLIIPAIPFSIHDPAIKAMMMARELSIA